MASPIRAGGIASGIDTNTLIQSLVSSASAPIRSLQTKRGDQLARKAIFQRVQSRLDTLNNRADGLRTKADFLTLSATTTDSEKITASASGSARAGTYIIEVQDLADTHKIKSSTLTAATATAVSAGDTFTITVDGEERTVTVDEDGATLAKIASYINQDAGDLVSATLVSNPSDGTATLFIESKASGSDGEMSFADTSGSALEDVGLLSGGAIANEQVAADDAELTVDGVPVATSSNSPTDVIEGLTLNLLEETDDATPITVSVQPDKAAIIKKVKDLISAYNDAVGVINQQFEFTGTAKGENTLTGDSTLRRIKTSLQGIIAGQIDGISHEYNALSRIGITSDRYGVLTVDETELGEAIENDFNAVANVFVDEDTGSTGVAARLFNALEGYTNDDGDFVPGFIDPLQGALAVRMDGIDDIVAGIDKQIIRVEARVAKLEENLVQQFTAMEVLIAQTQQQGSALARL